MQATTLPFSYSLSRPTFTDVTSWEPVKSSSPSGTPSPPAVCYPNRFETLLTSAVRPMWGVPFELRLEPAHTPFNDSFVKQPHDVRKKSFTIAAILGLNGYEDTSSSGKPDTRAIRLTNTNRRERLQHTTPYIVPPPATSKLAVTTMYPENKSKIHRRIEEGLQCPEVTNLANQSNGSPCNSTPSLHSLHGSSGNVQKSSSTHKKSKRVRTIFTPEQLEHLEAEFERQQYIVGEQRNFLAASLNLTEAQVKVYFQNRRIKWRKQHLDLQHARLAQMRKAENVNSSETKSEPSLISAETVNSPPYLDETI